MAGFRDLLAQAKSQIVEVDTADAAARLATGTTLALDVREPDEFEQGTLPLSIHIPRGHLEAQIESKITDKDAPIVVYCAGGVRSAFAAKTLQELGYTNVVSMAGGFGKWKDEGRQWGTPASLTAEQRNRYQRHILPPSSAIVISDIFCCQKWVLKARQNCLQARCCCWVLADLEALLLYTWLLPAWAQSALSTWTK